MNEILSPKQLKFAIESSHKINIAHGSVRSGKTIAATFRFLQAVNDCPDSQIAILGHTVTTVFNNIVRLILEPAAPGKPDPLGCFRPFCSWRQGNNTLFVKDKQISIIGAKDGGAIGAIQGRTLSLAYCDEITLYPESIIDMIDTRLSNAHSMLFASCNPSHPQHKIKHWIDKAIQRDPNYYQLHFTLDDNPFVEADYKLRVKNSLSGVFYKRNYLGEWCLAEGAIFDFFDRKYHVVKKSPRAAEYWIVGIDYGTNNAFAAVLIGVNTGRSIQSDAMCWVEQEYYWDSKERGRQKTSSEFADDIRNWLEPYAVKSIYVDPSAANFKLDLQRRGLHPVNADNDVSNGIIKMTSEVKEGRLKILEGCRNLIREIEAYVWDPKSIVNGEDEPLKLNDHAVDALRYAINTHKISFFDQDEHNRKGRMYLQEKNLRDGRDINWR